MGKNLSCGVDNPDDQWTISNIEEKTRHQTMTSKDKHSISKKMTVNYSGTGWLKMLVGYESMMLFPEIYESKINL